MHEKKNLWRNYVAAKPNATKGNNPITKYHSRRTAIDILQTLQALSESVTKSNDYI